MEKEKEEINARNNYYEVKPCLECKNNFESLITYKSKFCSHRCAGIFNSQNRGNSKRNKTSNCSNCGKVKKTLVSTYCSNNCKNQVDRKVIFSLIENGDTTLGERWYKLYLINKQGTKCMDCGWNQVNPTTGLVPTQLEHIDGKHLNNSLDNLKILCPNCHSLTPTYGFLNKGNGREGRQKWREQNKRK